MKFNIDSLDRSFVIEYNRLQNGQWERAEHETGKIRKFADRRNVDTLDEGSIFVRRNLQSDKHSYKGVAEYTNTARIVFYAEIRRNHCHIGEYQGHQDEHKHWKNQAKNYAQWFAQNFLEIALGQAENVFH